MSLIRPFRALRPVKEKVSLVAAVPYDVVNQKEALLIAKDNPYSFLHVSRPDIDLPATTDPYSSEVYERGAKNFKWLTHECPLLREEEPSLYVYQLTMGQHEQTGIAGCFSLDEYDSNLIKKHELTRQVKEEDRTRHILKLSAQTGPAFLAYRRVVEIDREVDKIKTHSPIYHFTTSDGITHTLWKISDPTVFVKLFDARISALYIADGHHRAAAASRVRKTLATQNPNHSGSEDYNFVFAVAFPDNQLNVLPYHRVIKDLKGMTPSQFLEKVQSLFEIQSGSASLPQSGEFGMYLVGNWYRIHSNVQKIKGQTKGQLDVSILQEALLKPILGILDPRTDPRIDFVGGIRGTSELEKMINSGEGAVAFSVHPTKIQDVMEVSDAGGIMPPKSTWFEPKLRDGILSHLLMR